MSTPSEPKPPVKTEIKIESSVDLGRALLHICSEAANGRADPRQASILCAASNTLINLTKLQLGASNGNMRSAPWLLRE